MSRQIITASRAMKSGVGAQQNTPKEEDPYVSKVLKLIPADIIAVYLSVYTLIKSASDNPNNNGLQWIVFGIIIAILPFYLRRTGVESWKQIGLCVLSFIIWVLSIGGPLDGQLIAGYSPQFLGSIVLPIYTLLIPILYEKVDP